MSRLLAAGTALLAWLAERAEARRLRRAACPACTDPDWPGDVPW